MKTPFRALDKIICKDGTEINIKKNVLYSDEIIQDVGWGQYNMCFTITIQLDPKEFKKLIEET
jgi:hypothetical protein